VSASVAARLDLNYDRIQELLMAVDEAATMVLQAGPATTITLHMEPAADASAVGVRITGDLPVTDWPGGRSQSWGWRVIDQLASGARLTPAGQPPGVSFSWAVDGRPDGAGAPGA
jgi:anti-sigma regulatory factor (Ser/Thr protein kinase)